MNKWISVEDKMPIKNEIVNVKGELCRHGVTLKKECIEKTRYYGDGIFERNVEQDSDYLNITHWAELNDVEDTG